MKLDNDARLRHDLPQYIAMLKELRRSEESFEDGSEIAFLLQVGKNADSVICKMFRYKRDRDTKVMCIFKSFAVTTNHFLPLGRFFFVDITVSVTF